MSKWMLKQIYYVQCWTLFKFGVKMNQPVDAKDNVKVNMIKEIRDIAFEVGQDRAGVQTLKRTRFAQDYKALGFTNTTDPTQDFQKAPGSLALELMREFASRSQVVFNRLIMESSCRPDGCPFVSASIELVKILCQEFNIDTDPKLHDNQAPIYAFILTQNQTFLHEMFSACIQHLFKTWREMRASVANRNDINRVMAVTRDQIKHSLASGPLKVAEFEKNLPTFTQITEKWKDGNKRRSQEESLAIRALKDVIKPDIQSLIQEQRLNYICEGTEFLKPHAKHGSKSIYVKLSANKKTLYYGDWNQQGKPEISDLPGKIAVCDIKDFITGECLDS